MTRIWSLLLCLIGATPLLAQDAIINQNDQLNFFVSHINETIEIDGLLDEDIWEQVGAEKDFWQFFPSDTTRSTGPTELYMAYDDVNLYIGIKCHTTGNEFVVPSLRRDYSFRGSDNFTIFFDTYKDKTNAFIFGINPYGVLREALLFNGGRGVGDFAMSWDNKWRGEAARFEDYWTAEIAIPFKVLRFNSGSEEWRFNCYRNDTQINEISSYAKVPRNLFPINMAYTGIMKWEKPLQKSGTNISMIPYVSSDYYRDFEDSDQRKGETGFAFGGDAKVAISSGLNLDLTVNPDFSQVEVDQQVTNLTRFQVLFPERRQFFLENADLFSGFGLSRVNPFFTRRIGLDAAGSPIPINFGARLSGKLNDNFRVGLLNMQTGKQQSSELPAFNYSVAALQHKVFDRSNVSFIMVNKQAVNPAESGGDFTNYNRVAGLEYRLASRDNRWSGKFFHHQVFSPEDVDHKFTSGAQLEYLERGYRLEYAHLFVGEGFDAEVGFVPRRDYALVSPELELFWFPTKGALNTYSVNVDTRMLFNVGKAINGNDVLSDWEVAEKEVEMAWRFQFHDYSTATFSGNLSNVTLLEDFDPTRVQENEFAFLPAGANYTYGTIGIGYESDLRKTFSYQINPLIGRLFSGYRAGVSGSFSYRFQPYGFVSIKYDYNHLKFDAPFKPVDFWLVGPRIDLTFSKKLFFSTFLQYNSQFDNLNINARLQWRYQPVSDFFIVFTDNYITDPFSQFSVRNRAIVAKMTYWLNL